MAMYTPSPLSSNKSDGSYRQGLISPHSLSSLQRSGRLTSSGRSVELRMSNSQIESPGFATRETLEPCAIKLQHDLRGLGYSQRVSFFGHTAEDAVSVLNCVHFALGQRQREVDVRNRIDGENRKLRSDIVVLERTIARLEHQASQREKDMGLLMNKSKQAEVQLRNDLGKMSRDSEDLVRRCGLLQQRQVQLQHEVRRKEAAFEKLQDKLRGMLAERKREAKNTMAIAGMFQQQAATAGGTRRAATRIDQEDLQRRIIEAYESKKADLESENRAIRRCLQDLQEEHKALLNHQLSHYLPPSPSPSTMHTPVTAPKEASTLDPNAPPATRQPHFEESASVFESVDGSASIDELHRQLDLKFDELRAQSKQLLGEHEGGDDEERGDDPELRTAKDLLADQNNVLAAAMNMMQHSATAKAEQDNLIQSLQQQLAACQAKSDELAAQVADTNSRCASLGVALAEANTKLHEANMQLGSSADPAPGVQAELSLLGEQLDLMHQSVAAAKDAQQIASMHATRMSQRSMSTASDARDTGKVVDQDHSSQIAAQLDQEQQLHTAAQKRVQATASRLMRDKQALQDLGDYDSPLNLLLQPHPSGVSSAIEISIDQDHSDIDDFDIKAEHSVRKTFGRNSSCTYDSHRSDLSQSSSSQYDRSSVSRQSPSNASSQTAETAAGDDEVTSSRRPADDDVNLPHADHATHPQDPQDPPTPSPAPSPSASSAASTPQPPPAAAAPRSEINLRPSPAASRIMSQWQPPEMFSSSRGNLFPERLGNIHSSAPDPNPNTYSHPPQMVGPHQHASSSASTHTAPAATIGRSRSMKEHEAMLFSGGAQGGVPGTSGNSGMSGHHAIQRQSVRSASTHLQSRYQDATAAAVAAAAANGVPMPHPSQMFMTDGVLSYGAGDQGGHGQAGVEMVQERIVYSPVKREVTSPTSATHKAGGGKFKSHRAGNAFLKLFGNGCMRTSNVDVDNSSTMSVRSPVSCGLGSPVNGRTQM